MEIMQWVLDFLKKMDLFVNQKNCLFYKDKVCFLGYVILSQNIRIENKKKEVVKN